MPNLKNAIKQVRKDEKRTERNMQIKADIKTLMKKARKAIDAKDKTVDEQITLIQKMIDKAVKKDIFKKNTGSRKLSRLLSYRNKNSK